MVAITPVPSFLAPGVNQYLWEALTESDTGATQLAGGTQPIHGSFQVVGSFGSGTIVLQESNDNVNFVTVQNSAEADISFTANGLFNFSSAAAYFRPFAAVAGSARDVDCFLVLRG